MKALNMISLFTILCLCFAGFVSAQTAGYQLQMKKGLDQAKTLTTAIDLENTAVYFERISINEKNQWLPMYYAAFYNFLAGLKTMTTPKEADKIFDKSMAQITQAGLIKPNESEILALKGQISYMQMAIDPSGRYQIYIPQAKGELDSAASLNPANPRVDFINGQQLYYTPEQYGGGKAAARPILQQAVNKFKTLKPATDLSPAWGETQAKTLLDLSK